MNAPVPPVRRPPDPDLGPAPRLRDDPHVGPALVVFGLLTILVGVALGVGLAGLYLLLGTWLG